jgi:nicotinamide-nucleotide amidase
MPDNNLLQADVPRGATIIPQTRGTAPGLICNVGLKVVYAVPGVPYEMSDMFERAILPDLLERQRQAGETSVIRSRVLRTWGTSESALAEAVADRFEALENGGNVTIAFLASGIEGIKVRLTVRADNDDEAIALLLDEERTVRTLIEDKFGDIIFGFDDESMEDVVAAELLQRGLTLAVAESLTGGLIASRLVNVPGASTWFRGGVVSYASQVKYDVLGVPEGPVVSGAAAEAMATGVRDLLKADIGLSVTGVAGPEEQEGQTPGTVFVGLCIGEAVTHSALRLPGDRPRIRAYSAISALDVLRRGLESSES